MFTQAVRDDKIDKDEKTFVGEPVIFEPCSFKAGHQCRIDKDKSYTAHKYSHTWATPLMEIVLHLRARWMYYLFFLIFVVMLILCFKYYS